MKQELDINAHRVPIDDLFETLDTDPNSGLSNDEARYVDFMIKYEFIWIMCILLSIYVY